MEQMAQIYAVTTEGEVRPISVVLITPESSGRRDALLQQKADIEAQLKEVEKQLL